MNQKEFNEYRKSQNFCHVYAAEQWHDNSYIVGDENALRGIKTAIDKALTEGRGICTLRPNDDETYQLHILKITNPTIENKLVLPYTEDVAIDKIDDKIHPFQLLHDPKFENNL